MFLFPRSSIPGLVGSNPSWDRSVSSCVGGFRVSPACTRFELLPPEARTARTVISANFKVAAEFHADALETPYPARRLQDVGVQCGDELNAWNDFPRQPFVVSKEEIYTHFGGTSQVDGVA